MTTTTATATDRYTYYQILHQDLTALDLRAEIQNAGYPYSVECASMCIDGKAERAQVAFFPAIGRAGIAWGADAQWTDCGSIEECIERYLNGEMCE